MPNHEHQLPPSVEKGYDTFFKLGREAQDHALPLLEQAAIERGKNFPGEFITKADRTAAENRWREYVQGLGDQFAQGLDEFYWPGHSGNAPETVAARVKFLNMLTGQNAESLLQTKIRIEAMLDPNNPDR